MARKDESRTIVFTYAKDKEKEKSLSAKEIADRLFSMAVKKDV